MKVWIDVVVIGAVHKATRDVRAGRSVHAYLLEQFKLEHTGKDLWSDVSDRGLSDLEYEYIVHDPELYTLFLLRWT